MTAVVDTSPADYHKQTSRYHYQVPPDEDDLESQPSVPRVIQTAVGPKQPEWRKIQQKTFTNWVNERLVTRNGSGQDVMYKMRQGVWRPRRVGSCPDEASNYLDDSKDSNYL